MSPDSLAWRVACALCFLLGLAGCQRPREVPVQTQRQASAEPSEDPQPMDSTAEMADAHEATSASSSAGQKAASEAAPATADASDAKATAGSASAAPRSAAASTDAASKPASSPAQRAAKDAPKLTPAAAAREARDGLAAARKAEQSGNAKGALEHALRGYQATRAHPKDPTCQQIAAELLPLLERVGEKVNSASGGAGSDANSQPFRVD